MIPYFAIGRWIFKCLKKITKKRMHQTANDLASFQELSENNQIHMHLVLADIVH